MSVPVVIVSTPMAPFAASVPSAIAWTSRASVVWVSLPLRKQQSRAGRADTTQGRILSLRRSLSLSLPTLPSLLFTHSITCSFTYSFTHSFTHSLTESVTCSLINPHSCPPIYSSIHPFIHLSYIHSHSLTCLHLDSRIRLFTHSFILSFVPSLTPLLTH